MSNTGFPIIFSSRNPLPTKTVLIKDDDGNNKNPKINWNTCVIDLEELGNGKSNLINLSPYYDNDEGLLDCLDIEDSYEIHPTKSGKFITSFHIPSTLIPAIIGHKGKKLRELQEMSQTLIKVPRIHETGVPVKITGNNERNVASARNQITLLILSKREKLPSTHFVSTPVKSNIIRANFEKFKKGILNGPATRGIDESIFQNPNKLHMTIEVLTLLDDLEIEDSKQLLMETIKNLRSSTLLKKQYEFKLKGIEIMNDNPSEVDVLYANIKMMNQKDQDDFQEAADQISNVFFRSGYVKKQYEHIKLHVTLMNSKFRKKNEDKRTTFDASYILKQFKNTDFGNAFLESFDLSIRFSVGKDGYYDSVISIPLTT